MPYSTLSSRDDVERRFNPRIQRRVRPKAHQGDAQDIIYPQKAVFTGNTGDFLTHSTGEDDRGCVPRAVRQQQ